MSIEKTAQGMWRVRWREGGRNRARTVGRKADAIAFDAEVRRRKRMGDLAAMDAGQQTLADFVQHDWYPRHAAPRLSLKTLNNYEKLLNAHVLPHLGALELRRLDADIVDAWLARLDRGGLGRESQRKALKLLRGVLSRAVRWGRVGTNPAEVVDLPAAEGRREVRPLAPESVEALRAQLLDTDRVGHATLISLVAYAGLRPQEALALEWRHVRERTLLVEQKNVNGRIVASTKTRANRSVRLLAPLAADLREYRIWTRHSQEHMLLFPGADAHTPWRESAWNNFGRRTFQQAAVAAGLGRVIRSERAPRRRYEGPRPYDLRHSFASLLIAEHQPITYVAQQLGHSPEMTLRTYAHVIDEITGGERVEAEAAIRTARETRDERREAV